MKRALSIFLMAVPFILLAGCGQGTKQDTTSQDAVSQDTTKQDTTSEDTTSQETITGGVTNPVHDSTADDILQTLGITFHLPSDASDIVYTTIDSVSGNPVAQVFFTEDGIQYTYRIQSVSEFTDISGAYFTWTSTKDIEVSYCSGKLNYIEGSAGICQWYDTVPGLMYSLYVETGASEALLTSMADELYVPAQDAP